MIRHATEQDFEQILALNQAFVHLTSDMDRIKLTQLVEQSYYCKVVELHGEIAAFLLAFAPDAQYESVNYQWFQQRYVSFVYIDRIVVDTQFQGKKLGAALYKDLFADATQHGIQCAVCEYNSEPVNLGSQKFHQTFGFIEVGSQRISAEKVVSMQLLELTKG